jgi:signal transduction histidine kinase
MSPAHPRSVQWWLGALVTGVAAPVLLLVFVLGHMQMRREQGEARELALQVAKATATRLRTRHEESATLLRRLAGRPGVRALDPAACRTDLAVVDYIPRYADIYLYDGAGRLVCSGNTDPQNVRLSSMAHLWIERELRTGRLNAAELGLHTFGRQSMMVTAAPIGGRAGTIVLLEFIDAVAQTALLPGSVIMIIDGGGKVVARSHASVEWSGENIGGTRIGELGLQANEGTAAARGVDGVSRQFAFARLRELGWTIYCGVPSTAIARPAREMLVNGAVGVLGTAVILTVMTLALARRIGRPIHALASAAAVTGDGVYARVAPGKGPREVTALADAFNDMIDRRERADGRMRDGERKLKALSERLLTVQEEERARIARELHDDLGQSLTALKMDVVGLLQATEQPPALAPIRDRILRTLDSTVTSVQRISSELRPSVLDDLGLVAAIEAEARLFEERSGIECEVSVTGEVPVDTDSITAIYRIVQEGLTNVARHSNATRTELRLRARGDELLLEIRDDGRGVTGDEITDPLSLGLIGIRERAAVIGGTVQIEGVAGRGTIVSVRIPLEAKARLA